jgi:hypothetical protein
MPEAQALYRSSGYREVDDYNGNPWAAVWFEKRLEPRPPGGRAREEKLRLRGAE